MRFLHIALATVALSAADIGRGAMAEPVAEIVTFRLMDGADASAFLAAAEGMMPFLEETGAFLNRTISVDETGEWTDHISWTSMAAAKSAAAAMMEQPEAGPFMALIDPETVKMRHATIRFSQPKEHDASH